MKKTMAWILALAMVISLIGAMSTSFAAPDQGEAALAEESAGDSAEGESTEDAAAEGESAEGESEDAAAEGESAEGESEDAAVEGESAEGESEDAAAEGDSAEGESEDAAAEGDSAEGESEDAAAEGESAEGDSAEGESAEGESEGMDGNAATSNAAPEGSIVIATGEKVLEGEEISVWEGSAIENTGDSVIVARNCTIMADTEVETAPLAGLPGNLLVAGNIRATLAMGHAQSFYINSSVTSRNWATLSTDGGEPAVEEGQKEVSVYAYGTQATALDGGYGTYSDLLCNVYIYGSQFQSAELGIISGTYGTVTVGTIGDGEANEELAAYLSDEDKAVHEDKEEGSVIAGGRNAIMIHSVSLPPYWEYEGYSQEELPLLSAPISVHGSTLKTDLSLNAGVKYDDQKQAYIDHTAGSVVLIKSTNTEITLEDTEVIADPAGTGYAFQTVYNNDNAFMLTVPEGEQYPGIHVNAAGSTIEGGIAHEDYQRDFYLTLDNSTFNGDMNEYDCAHWNEAAAAEGFDEYALDAAYETKHGLFVDMKNGAVWNVTAESRISGITFEDGCTINGTITVDGEVVEAAGEYTGEIVVTPAE